MTDRCSRVQKQEAQREKCKIICQYYLVCSRTPVVSAGLEPYTPSRQDVQAQLKHSEVVPQSQLCSGLRSSLCQRKKCKLWQSGPVNITLDSGEPIDPDLTLQGCCQDLQLC